MGEVYSIFIWWPVFQYKMEVEVLSPSQYWFVKLVIEAGRSPLEILVGLERPSQVP